MSDLFNYMRNRVREEYRMKYALRSDERKALIQETSVNGLVLFEYYLRMASVGNIELGDDTQAAEYFGWSPHTAARWRRELTKTGWFHMEKAKLPSGKNAYVYYLGKDPVAEVRGTSD